MHWMKWNFGDYALESARMTNGQDLAFRRLIELYAKTEEPLEKDVEVLAVKVGCSSDDVKHVLLCSWFATDLGWVHKPTHQQIQSASARSMKNRENISRRWSVPNESNTSRIPVEYESDTTLGTGYLGTGSDGLGSSRNGTVTSSNVTPSHTKPPKVTKPDDVPQQVWDDWLVLRKAKKAPVTDTALKRLRSEAGKAGLSLSGAMEICAQNGWQGLQAGWIKRNPDAKSHQPQQDRHRSEFSLGDARCSCLSCRAWRRDHG